MLIIDRPHGRSAHTERVAMLRSLQKAGLLVFKRAVFIRGRRHYLVTHNNLDLLLRETDVEPYVIGMANAVTIATGKPIQGPTPTFTHEPDWN